MGTGTLLEQLPIQPRLDVLQQRIAALPQPSGRGETRAIVAGLALGCAAV